MSICRTPQLWEKAITLYEKNNTEDAQSFKPDEYSQVDFNESDVPF